MKKIGFLIFIMLFIGISAFGIGCAEVSDKYEAITNIAKELTDDEKSQSCMYDENSDVLLYEFELPIEHAQFQKLPVEEYGEYYDRFEWMAEYMKESIVDIYAPGTTSVVLVIASDRIPIAVFVNTTDVLRGWF